LSSYQQSNRCWVVFASKPLCESVHSGRVQIVTERCMACLHLGARRTELRPCYPQPAFMRVRRLLPLLSIIVIIVIVVVAFGILICLLVVCRPW
jgi:hypothetical protein